MRVEGSREFRGKVREALKLIRAAGKEYYDLLRGHIRCIREIEGLTQLRIDEATIWANKYAVEDPVDAAGRLIQEAYYMKLLSEGDQSHEGMLEYKSFEKRIEFLRRLMEVSRDEEVRRRCERLIKMWDESQLIY